MNKIRSRAGLLIIVIGVAMVSFILTDMFNGLTGGRGANTQNIGEVHGQKVDLQEFYDQYQANLANNQTPDDPDARYRILNQTWDGYCNQIIFEKEYESSGMAVHGQELVDLFVNPPFNSPIRNIFRDSLGRFNPNLVRQQMDRRAQIGATPTTDEDKRFVQDWQNLEDYIYQNRIQEKYLTLLQKSATISDYEAKQRYMSKYTSRDISFVAVNFELIPDAEVEPTEEDFRKYYNDHKTSFPQDDETDMIYAYFLKTPSKEDTTLAFEKLNKIVGEFKNAENDTTFVSRYRGVFDTTWKSIDELPAVFAGQMASAEKGTVLGPKMDADGFFKLAKLIDVKEGENPFIKLRHIQVQIEGLDLEDTIAARNKANEIRATLTKENFAQKAMELSTDRATQTTGGELGWFSSENPIGEEFYNDLKDANIGEFRVVKSIRGFHVVEIMDKSSKQFVFATIASEVYASTSTLNKIRAQANVFAGKAFNTKDLKKIAEEEGVKVFDSPTLTPQIFSLPDLQGAKPIIDWALRSEEGEVNDKILQADNAFVVAQVTAKRKDGFRSLEDIKDLIRPEVVRIKKAKVAVDKLNAIQSTDLDQIASQYGGGAFVGKAENVTFDNPIITGIGNAPYIVGKVSVMEQNEISEPLVGQQGVYVVRIDKAVDPVEPDPSSVAAEKGGILQNFASEATDKSYRGMKELAEIEDLRYLRDW